MTKTAYRKAALVDVKHDRDKWTELGVLVKEHYLVRSMTPKDWFIIVKQREGYEIEVYPTFEMSDGFQFSHVNLLTDVYKRQAFLSACGSRLRLYSGWSGET